jgi:hypothetical protein
MTLKKSGSLVHLAAFAKLECERAPTLVDGNP